MGWGQIQKIEQKRIPNQVNFKWFNKCNVEIHFHGTLPGLISKESYETFIHSCSKNLAKIIQLIISAEFYTFLPLQIYKIEATPGYAMI